VFRRALTSAALCALALLACAARARACSCVGPGSVFRLQATTLLPLAGDPAGTGGTLLRSGPQRLNVAGPSETVTLVIKRTQ
jgi:hypothetical protein